MAIPEEKVAELKKAHGDIWVLERDGMDFAFRAPRSIEYREWVMTVARDKVNQFDANESIAKACFVYPDANELHRRLEAWPGLVMDLGGEVMLVAKPGVEARAKKA